MSLDKTGDPKSRQASLRALIEEASYRGSPETLSVLADWCHEHGLDDQGDQLKDESEIVRLGALTGLRGLFGVSGAGGSTGRYAYPLGFPTTNVPAGVSVVCSTQPQISLRVRRVVIPGRIAPYLLVTEVKVGKNSLFACANPVPAETFALVGPDLFDDVADVSSYVSIYLTNISGNDLTFNGCALGILTDDFDVQRGQRMHRVTSAELESLRDEMDERALGNERRLAELEAAIIRMAGR